MVPLIEASAPLLEVAEVLLAPLVPILRLCTLLSTHLPGRPSAKNLTAGPRPVGGPNKDLSPSSLQQRKSGGPPPSVSGRSTSFVKAPPPGTGGGLPHPRHGRSPSGNPTNRAPAGTASFSFVASSLLAPVGFLTSPFGSSPFDDEPVSPTSPSIQRGSSPGAVKKQELPRRVGISLVSVIASSLDQSARQISPFRCQTHLAARSSVAIQTQYCQSFWPLPTLSLW